MRSIKHPAWLTKASVAIFAAATSLAIAAPALGQVWIQGGHLIASDPGMDDQLGISISLSGDRALIGAGFDDGPGGLDSGSAYLFELQGPTWSEVQKLSAQDATLGDLFGFSVAIDGDRAMVGAPLDDHSLADAGSAYIFERIGDDQWQQVAKLDAGPNAESDPFGNFGSVVALDGDVAMISAWREDVGGVANAGVAYVYERAPNGDWNQTARLFASDPGAEDAFGSSLAVSGNRAIVGAWWDDAAGTDSGSAYVFEKSGGNWRELAKITADDADAFDNFGVSVDIDGNRAIVSAWEDDVRGLSNAGSAYIFDGFGATWLQTDQLVPTDIDALDNFGTSVALDGNLAVVGSWHDDSGAGTDVGSAYVFERSGIDWSQIDKIVADDASAFDNFGIVTDIEGDRVLVGANGDVHSGVDAAGSAYVFESTLDSFVVGRFIFYNNSAFDDNDPRARQNDIQAVALDKAPLLPGGTATIVNYTSYSRGINGIIVDVQNLADPFALSEDDLEFRVGNNDDPSSWGTAPDPAEFAVRTDEGIDGSTRVTATWDDNAIEGEWLQVKLLANENTGLMDDDVFYFGNAIGDAGDTPLHALVDGSDFAAVRDEFPFPFPITNPLDFNRDMDVNDLDSALVQDHATNLETALRLITVPGSVAASSIPEPSTILLAALGLLVCLSRRRPQ